MKNSNLIFNAFFSAILLLMPIKSYAALSVNASPLQGGNSLRFGRVSGRNQVDKEVKLRITSTDGQQYQVFQRITNSLTNEFGQALDHHAIETYSLSGSNGSGTLYMQNKEDMNLGDQLVYTSGRNGESDSFTLVYSVDPANINKSGNFFGKIQYTARPIGAASHDQVFLNVYLESESQFNVEIVSSSGGNIIRLNSKKGRNDGYVKVAFDGNLSQEVKIYQEINSLPQESTFQELGPEVLRFYTQGGPGYESNYQVISDLPRGRKLIYKSMASSDTVYIHYLLDEKKVINQKSGDYRGQILLEIEMGDQRRREEVVLEAEIMPVFEIEIVLPPEGMRFDRLLPMNPPQIKEVTVKVHSNLGKPYMINQVVSSALTNENGDILKAENFSLKGEIVGKSPGEFRFPDFQPVVQSQQAIYVSDAKGSSSEFKVYYRLKPYPEMKAGSYSTSIVYSLGEI